MGELQVPADALWGAQTQRAVENFPISGQPMPRGFIRALGLIKAAAADVNAGLDLMQGTPDGKNVDHICLVIEAVDLGALVESGRFDVVGGPAELFGARGQGQAIYVRDPDGNVIELRHYGSS